MSSLFLKKGKAVSLGIVDIGTPESIIKSVVLKVLLFYAAYTAGGQPPGCHEV